MCCACAFRAARRAPSADDASAMVSTGLTEKERKDKEKVTVIVMCQV